jgi:hypothetical protein
MHTGQCSRHQFQVMSVNQLVKRQEGPQTCLEGPGRCISTMDKLATPQLAHKAEVDTAKGRPTTLKGRPTTSKGHPTTSKGRPTLHDFAKYVIQCPTRIKDVPYITQSLAVGQPTRHSHNQCYIVGRPRDERDIPSDTSLARKCLNAGLHSNTETKMCTSTCLQYKKVGIIVRFHNYKVTDVVNLAIRGALLLKVLVIHNCL